MSRFGYGECDAKYICPEEEIYPAMKELIETDGKKPWVAAQFIEKDSDGKVTAKRAECVWRRRVSSREEKNDKITAKIRQMVVSEPHRLFTLADFMAQMENGTDEKAVLKTIEGLRRKTITVKDVQKGKVFLECPRRISVSDEFVYRKNITTETWVQGLIRETNIHLMFSESGTQRATTQMSKESGVPTNIIKTWGWLSKETAERKRYDEKHNRKNGD